MKMSKAAQRAGQCPYCEQRAPGWRGHDADVVPYDSPNTLVPEQHVAVLSSSPAISGGDSDTEPPHQENVESIVPTPHVRLADDEVEPIAASDVSDHPDVDCLAKTSPALSATNEPTVLMTLADADSEIANSIQRNWKDSLSPDATPMSTLRRSDVAEAQRLGLVIKTRTLDPEQDASDRTDYEKGDRLGSGGMGIVHDAKQTSINRSVAVKTLQPELVKNVNCRNRFLAEAALTGKLAHPNIIPIHDMGFSQNGELFYSMKKVTGTPWHTQLRENSLATNLDILLKVCDAVAFAHSQDVIHRDLKAENVMLGQFNEVLVMDWGLAIELRGDDVPKLGYGTPAYMPPEMVIGPAKLVGPASDIYLLGAMLFEIVVGCPPHPGNRTSEVLEAAARNVIISFTGDDSQQALLSIAMRAMATQPADRYPSVLEFQRAIEEFEEHEESISLTKQAEDDLKEAVRQSDYDRFARALFALQDACRQWPGNERAAAALIATRLAYAECALRNSNYELGMSVLNVGNPDEQRLYDKLWRGAHARDVKNRTLRRVKWAVVGLLCILLATMSSAYLYTQDLRFKAEENAMRAKASEETAQRERDKALRQEEIATESAELAKQNETKANAMAIAATQAQRAAEQRKQEADAARAEADDARIRAEQNAEDAIFGRFVSDVALAATWVEAGEPTRALHLLERLASQDQRRIDWEWHRLYSRCHGDLRRFQVDASCAAVCTVRDMIVTASNLPGGLTATAIVAVWDRESFQPIRRQSLDRTVIHALDASPTSPLVAIGRGMKANGQGRGVVDLFDVSSGTITASVVADTQDVFDVRFSSDGQRLVTAGNDGHAKVWDVVGHSLENPRSFQARSSFIHTALISRDGKWLVTSEGGKRDRPQAVMVWPISGGPNDARYMAHRGITTGEPCAAAISPDANVIATATKEGEVLLWDWANAPALAEASRTGTPRIKPRTLAGHQMAVRALAFNPDGTRLLSASDDRTLVVWNLASQRAERSLAGHATPVVDCRWEDDDRVISVSSDGEVRLWQLSKLDGQLPILTGPNLMSASFDSRGNLVTTHRDGLAAVRSLSGSRSSRLSVGHAPGRLPFMRAALAARGSVERLFTAGDDGQVWCWDAATGKPLFSIEGIRSDGRFAVSDDGQWMASAFASQDLPARVWSVAGTHATPVDADLGAVEDLAFLPRSNQLLVRLRNDRIVLKDLPRNKEVWSTELRADLWAIADDASYFVTATGTRNGLEGEFVKWTLPRDGAQPEKVSTGSLAGVPKQLALGPRYAVVMVSSTRGNDANMAELWDIRAWRRRFTTTREQAIVSGTISPDSDTPTLLDNASRLYRWDVETGHLDVHSLSEQLRPDRPRAIWGAAQNRLLTSSSSKVDIWDLTGNHRVAKAHSRGRMFRGRALNDGSRVITWDEDGIVRQWQTETPQASVLHQFAGPDVGELRTMAPGSSNRWLSVGSQSARIWHADDSRRQVLLADYDGSGRCADWSADGTMVAIGAPTSVTLWNANSGGLLAKLRWRGDVVHDVQFSQNGRTLTVVGQRESKGWAQVFVNTVESNDWDAVELSEAWTAITRVAYSASGRRLVTGDEHGSLVIWYFDPLEKFAPRELMTLSGHRARIQSIEFSEDGRDLLTASEDGTVILWKSSGWRKTGGE
jgi:hypothetical protein